MSRKGSGGGLRTSRGWVGAEPRRSENLRHFADFAVDAFYGFAVYTISLSIAIDLCSLRFYYFRKQKARFRTYLTFTWCLFGTSVEVSLIPVTVFVFFQFCTNCAFVLPVREI